MYNSDTELLFPSRVIPSLSAMRGEDWKSLINRVYALPPDNPDHLAFVLMMIKLGGCISCNADSFRAMRGCTACARQTIRRYRGSDAELDNLFLQARQEVLTNLAKFTGEKTK